MKTYRSIKTVLGIVGTALALSILSVSAFAAELPEQALSHANPRVQEVMAVQEAVTPDLMSMPDVLGTAVSQDDGELTILVYVNLEGKNPAASARNIPKSLRGKSIKVEFTDPFRALGKPAPIPTSPVSHKTKQTPPIQLGTSGGWSKDLANGYCCGGTLGSLVQIGGVKYILSNYHVFESDIVAGENGVAISGDPIIQPGLIDVGCNVADAQAVATLVKIESLPGSNVDASVAKVVSGMVDGGSILEIGTISATTVAASVNQAVKKSGRTTGLTRSKVSGLNATVSVAYDNECAGGIVFTKTFKGQIIISNKASKFLAGGDSGSLMVQDVATNPKAVGLLFAGSSSLAVANPINEVLTYVGGKVGGTGTTATMVGN